MRILVAAAETAPPTYPSVNAIFGEGLANAGHEVVGLFYDEEGPADARWGGEVIRVPRPRRSPWRSTAASLVREWRALDRAFATAKPFDAVIVRDDPIMAVAALRWRHRHGPVIFQISHLNAEEIADHAREGLYGSAALNRMKSWGVRTLRALGLARADHVLVMTPEMREALTLDGRRCTIVGEGVGRDWAADMTAEAVRARYSLARDTPVLIYAGTFNRVRHLEVLLDAHREIVAAMPGAVLLLAGRGRGPDDERFLEERTLKLGLDRSIRYLGAVPHARVASLFDAADVVISPFPSTSVLRCNSPTRLFEAMHRGRPLVAGDIPEQRRVVEAAACGVLVDHSAGSIALGALRILMSPAEGARMGARGRSWVLANRTYESLALVVDSVLRRPTRFGDRPPSKRPD